MPRSLPHTPRMILFAGALTAALLACSLLPGGDGETPAPATPIVEPVEATDPPPAGDGVSGECADPFFPVAVGNQWTYFSEDSIAGPYGWTDQVTDVRADGFTLTAEFTDLTRVQEWACGPEGLTALSLGGGAAGAVSTGGSTLVIQTSNVEGVTLPGSLAAGDTWSHTLNFTGVQDFGDGTFGDVEGAASSSYTAIGGETVTVSAGTFEAFRIDQDLSLTLTVIIGGGSMPVTISAVSSVWYVEGIGLVKTFSEGTMLEEPFAETIELTGFSIP